MNKLREPIFAANWKMNKAISEVEPFAKKLLGKLETLQTGNPPFAVFVFPPATHLSQARTHFQGSPVQVGAQNSGPGASGAFTGEIAPKTLAEAGATWSLLGHSERRHVFKEDDDLILKRMKAAFEGGLKVMLCVGETLADRKAGKTFSAVESQLSIVKEAVSSSNLASFALAYEPVWAIGTGENATPQQAEEVHAFIRGWLAKNGFGPGAESVRILYGGSAKPDNSQALMGQPNIDGLLVGGASLEADTFAELVKNGLTSALKS